MTLLRQRMIDEMTLRGFSPKTHTAYIAAVAGLARYHARPPDQLCIDHVQAYLLHCLRDRQLSDSTCRQILNGLRFFYLKTAGWSTADFDLPSPKKKFVLPEVLNRSELQRLFAFTRNLKHQTLLKTTYAAGLRVSEVVQLRVRDLESERMVIRVAQGKGGKDRYTLLTPSLLSALRAYYKVYRPAVWLFPSSQAPQHALSIQSAQRVFTRAKRLAGIAKLGGIHALRHSFATHQLEAGMPIHRLQGLLGHQAIGSTLRYIHLANVPSYLIEGAADLLGWEGGEGAS